MENQVMFMSKSIRKRKLSRAIIGSNGNSFVTKLHSSQEKVIMLPFLSFSIYLFFLYSFQCNSIQNLSKNNDCGEGH